MSIAITGFDIFLVFYLRINAVFYPQKELFPHVYPQCLVNKNKL
ncbi:hypothetical protein M876_15655 [Elizabethkingia anophelis FMS-007]|nr:hypothetical protein M876_15655 [Elizabethkingia anophelis FMS-007]